MADIEDKRTQQLLRGIVRDETRKIVRDETRKIVRQETPKIVHRETRKIVREETRKIIHKETRKIVREETHTIVHKETREIVQAEMGGIRTELRADLSKMFREETRKIVQEETADMRADIKAIKIDVSAVREVQGGQSLKLQSLQAAMGSLKNSFRGQQREMHRLGGLFEDLDNRFAAVSEVQ